MPHAKFVHLRVHTAYSLLEGAIRSDVLAELCQRHDMPAVAFTDSGNLFGALEFSEALVKGGVQPIVGTALGLLREEDSEANSNGQVSQGREQWAEADAIVLLAQNEVGYGNLIRLSSRSFLESEAQSVAALPLAALEGQSEGLIALTGGPAGPLGRLLAAGRKAPAEALLERLAALFPGRLYIELQRHGLAEEDRIEGALVELAYRLELPLVATNEAYFTEAEMFEAHDALICVAEGNFVSQSERRRLTPEHRFKSPAEMEKLFQDLPEAIANTLVIARRCAYRPPLRDPILPPYESADGRDERHELKAQAEAGLEVRLEAQVFAADMSAEQRAEVAQPYRERLAFELDVIIEMGFSGYFLIVADFIKWAKDQDIPVGPGRGSGAGSVVAWVLTITDLDPLRFGLLFERFLNPDRISMPDFDIDFCQDRRDEVIHYVQQKYGRDRVAQIITFGKLQARAVLRDVGRVLEIPYGRVDGICKMVPNNPANPVSLGQAIADEPRLQQERGADPTIARLLDIGLKLEGLYRHASTHAAGVVIGDRPLDTLVPLYRDPRSDMPVTQFSMKYVEMAGLVKFDFLGLKTLTVIDKTLKLLQARGEEIDIAAIPLDDPGTYELLARGETIGVFQFESRGMQDLLKDAVPGNFEDLIALVALFRPGPMENIPKYVACKHGNDEPEFLHDTITPVTKDTYGVIIYQEQVMQIAQVFAGYSLGQADILRRAMGKKIKAEMRAQRDTFVAGAIERGVDRDRAAYVFDLVEKFAGYGFNKAHSAGYALVAYQTAWLKQNFPVEFMAASMTLDMGNTDKLEVFQRELERLEIPLNHPDINRSDVEFAVEYPHNGGKPAIRYALAAIKNVGRQAMAAVVEERERQGEGPFADLFDLAGRIDPRVVNKRQVENLTRAGAFDGLDANRARVFAAAEQIVRHAQLAAEARDSQQESLFGGDGGESLAAPTLPEIEPWLPMEALEHERDALGFYLSAHPLDAFERDLKRLGITSYTELAGRRHGEGGAARLAGTVMSVRERSGNGGGRFAFVQFSDSSGGYEVVVFADLFATQRQHIVAGANLLLTVDIKSDGDSFRLSASDVRPLDQVVAAAAAGLAIAVTDAASVDRLQRLIESQAKPGKGRICLLVRFDEGRQEAEIELNQHFAISPPLREAIAHIPGVGMVKDI
ncbi:MAG: DNA polymerase III subunit alpha [Alphaproteobacteria bacterium]|nr:DNA polymerase III subunit alpha [Rhodospirillaceae bacterium]MDP6407262.1 DNA polymerase III subunit alpha [Alphaproteobacteria bacterium]MDP6621610.1 DNA polymerase III subunit alpha [Alphaproteobacteria bacterium]